MKKLSRSLLLALSGLFLAPTGGEAEIRGPLAQGLPSPYRAGADPDTSSNNATTATAQKVKPTAKASSLPKPILLESSFQTLKLLRIIAQLQQGMKTGGQLDAMFPIFGNASQFSYANLQGYIYGTQYKTGSIGGGHRFLFQEAIYGAYGFYDYQISSSDFSYDRYNLGVERLSNDIDVRANFYYYPIDSNQLTYRLSDTPLNGFISNNNIFYTYPYATEVVVTSGADIEIGRALGFDQLRGYVGYYNYGSNVIEGMRARLTYDINQRWQLTASTQHDNARGWLTYGGLSYWFGTPKASFNNIADRMRDPVVRDMTIAAYEGSKFVTTEQSRDNIYFVSTTGNANGLGTQDSPMDLDTALSTAKDGDYIYIESGNYNLNNVIHLSNGQNLWGAGTAFAPNGYALLGANTAPTLNANNAGLGGSCGILGAAACAIFVDHTSNYTGFTLDGGNTARRGIYVGGLDSITPTLSNLTVNNFDTAGALAGIRVDNARATVNFSNITSSYNGAGLSVNAGKVYVTGTASSFNNNAQAGVSVTGSTAVASINNAQANANGVHGFVSQNSANLSLYNVTSLNNRDSGLFVSSATANVVNSVFDFNSYGAVIQSNSTLSMQGSSLSNNTTDGLDVVGASTASITSSQINNNTVDGIYADNDGAAPTNSTVNIYGSTTISNNGRYGIFANQRSAIMVNTGGVSISDNATGALFAQISGNIFVTNPLVLIGNVTNSLANTGTITITTSGGPTYSVTPDQTINCTTTAGVVSCR